MIWRRIIEPFGEPIDFSLYNVIDTSWDGIGPKLSELEDWIVYGGVSLRVIALEAYLTEEDRALLRDDRFCSVGGGSSEHRTMIPVPFSHGVERIAGRIPTCNVGLE
jgi:hypothetical protein